MLLEANKLCTDLSEAKSIFIYFYASSPDAAAWMLKFVLVYLANTAVLCYSLTIICCCQVQDYIYWIISTENDHHKFIKYEKRLRKEGKNMLGLPIKQNLCHFEHEFGRVALPRVCCNGPTDPHLEDTSLLFIFSHVDTIFCPRTTCCLLFLKMRMLKTGSHRRSYE